MGVVGRGAVAELHVRQPFAEVGLEGSDAVGEELLVHLLPPSFCLGVAEVDQGPRSAVRCRRVGYLGRLLVATPHEVAVVLRLVVPR